MIDLMCECEQLRFLANDVKKHESKSDASDLDSTKQLMDRHEIRACCHAQQDGLHAGIDGIVLPHQV
jgi:hypothetical protein